MFSSNQILQISGNLSHDEELSNALEFAMKFHGQIEHMTKEEVKRGCKTLYQITPDGKYCIGWGFKDIPEGWNEYPFMFDIDIVSRIIKQHLRDFPLEEGNLDGLYSKGFLMKAIKESFSYESDGIKEPFYGIVSFEPYTCYYSK